MASVSVVAEFCDELVSASPVGPLQCVINGGNSRQHDADQQTPHFRYCDGNQIRIPFFDGCDATRERITDNVA